MSKETFEERMKKMNQLVIKDFPHVWIDTYLFTLAMILVIAAAIFAVIAVELDIVTWYPLCILVIPAIIACWTARRRSLYTIKLNKFHQNLNECLGNFSMMDSQNHSLQWTYRAANDIDRRNCESSLNYSRLNNCINKNHHHAAILVIEIIRQHVDSRSQRPSGTFTNNNSIGQDDITEILPMYTSVTQDIILDMGPPPQHSYFYQQDQQQQMEENSFMLAFPPPIYRSYPNSTTPSFSQRSVVSTSR
ncbi:hypothetical protein BDC45DRAFT_506121 [Circinella umbellata]|nr:hypothetical protein BDC45DRAFT_506121 [Circinella umbellata]